MCPDKSLLSAYYDNEVDEPWKEEIKNHLANCNKCRILSEEWQKVSLFLKEESDSNIQKSRHIIYNQVMQQHRRGSLLSFWERKSAWPIGVAALVVLGLSLLFSLPAANDTGSSSPLVLIEDDKVDLSAMDNLIPIMLPPEQKFSYYGDSQLLKAAGFEGGGIP